MKIFRNPIFAVVLCAILILCSTLLSVHIRLGAKCDQVKDMLFTGVESNGYARKGIATFMCNVVRLFEMVPGLKNKLCSVAPVLIDELRLSDMYYVDEDRVMRAIREQGVEERVDDIDDLMNDEIFSSNEPERIAGRCPVFYDALKRREVETVMVVRIAMDNARTNGYLICAEPRSRRIWQEEECAVVFFLAKLIANRIRIDGETLK